MTWLTSIAFLGLAAVSAARSEQVAAGPSPLPTPVPPLERAQTIAAGVKKNFRDSLSAAVAKRGPDKSMDYCRVDAPKLTVGEAAEFSVEVGRTSHKLRNASNAARDWMKPILAKWSKLPISNMPSHELVEIDEETAHYGYLEPIVMEPICLSCHGTFQSNNVKEAIKGRWPKDQAVGFNTGDFRGLLWVELKRK